jgi:hypothetical protein
MIQLSEEFAHVDVAGPATFKNLTLFSLMRNDGHVPELEYLLLDEAIAKGLARVSEVGSAGSVPELRLITMSINPCF